MRPMPYHRITPSAIQVDPAMVEELANELRTAPDSESGENSSALSVDANTPDIRQEVTHRGVRHVRVIWDRWGKLNPEQRGHMIIEAYRRSQGEDVARQIAIAMGLTSGEAQRLGFVSTL